MRHLLGAIASFIIFTGTTAQASILIEPYLGYHMGKYEQGGTTDDASGHTIGGRLGMSHLGFQFGVDYMMGEWSIDTDPKTNGSLSDLGIFAAYEFPLLLRVFGTYFFDAELKDDDKLEGNKIRLGVGFSPLPFVDLNLEYMTATYGKLNGQNLDSDAKMNMYGVSVSIPFTL